MSCNPLSIRDVVANLYILAWRRLSSRQEKVTSKASFLEALTNINYRRPPLDILSFIIVDHVVYGSWQHHDWPLVLIHIVWKLLKMSHLNSWILTFPANFCPIKINLSGNTVWPQNSPEWIIFNLFLSTQIVNVARFARNLEWYFFCDFQTPCWQLKESKFGILRITRMTLEVAFGVGISASFLGRKRHHNNEKCLWK